MLYSTPFFFSSKKQKSKQSREAVKRLDISCPMMIPRLIDKRTGKAKEEIGEGFEERKILL